MYVFPYKLVQRANLILLIKIKMVKQRGKVGKYSKISLQKKYALLKSCLFDNLTLKQTSKNLQINYSTAKTILFQYQRKKIKSSLAFFDKKETDQTLPCTYKFPQLIAHYKEYDGEQNSKKKVQIQCTSNGQNKNRRGQLIKKTVDEHTEHKNLSQQSQLNLEAQRNDSTVSKNQQNNRLKSQEVQSQKLKNEGEWKASYMQNNNKQFLNYDFKNCVLCFYCPTENDYVSEVLPNQYFLPVFSSQNHNFVVPDFRM